MKDLIKQYLDNGMSRRQLMTGLSALGMSSVAVKSVAQSLETFGQGVSPPAAAVRQMKPPETPWRWVCRTRFRR